MQLVNTPVPAGLLPPTPEPPRSFFEEEDSFDQDDTPADLHPDESDTHDLRYSPLHWEAIARLGSLYEVANRCAGVNMFESVDGYGFGFFFRCCFRCCRRWLTLVIPCCSLLLTRLTVQVQTVRSVRDSVVETLCALQDGE